jgi:hypothetical protein
MTVRSMSHSTTTHLSSIHHVRQQRAVYVVFIACLRAYTVTDLPYPTSLAFNILPHPAKTNDPSDLQRDDPESHGGLRSSNPNAAAMPGPHIPSKEVAENLEQPKSREEVSPESIVVRWSVAVVVLV